MTDACLRFAQIAPDKVRVYAFKEGPDIVAAVLSAVKSVTGF
jgi:hypothetical protein